MASAIADSNRSTPLIDLTLESDDEDVVLARLPGQPWAPQPVASGSRPRAAPPAVFDISSDEDDVVEVDRNGREIPRAAAAPIRPHNHAHPARGIVPFIELPPPRNQVQRQNNRDGLAILDPAPLPPRPGPPRAQNRLGGGLISVNRNTIHGGRRPHDVRVIGPAPPNPFLNPNDDGGGAGADHDAPAPFSIMHLLENLTDGVVGYNGFWDFNFGFGEFGGRFRAGGAQQGAPAENIGNPITGEFDPMFIHRSKHPRPGFTYTFDEVPKTPWKPISQSQSHPDPNQLSDAKSSSLQPPPSTQPTSRFGLGSFRPSKRPITIDLVDDEDEDGTEPPTLFCANESCARDLVLDGEGADKIWGLRCGHLICGACIDSIGIPPAPPPQTLVEKIEEEIRKKDKGKGKGKARDVETEKHFPAQHAFPMDVDDLKSGFEYPEPNHDEASTSLMFENMYSSRLRSRDLPPNSHSSSQPSTSAAEPSSSRTLRSNTIQNPIPNQADAQMDELEEIEPEPITSLTFPAQRRTAGFRPRRANRPSGGGRAGNKGKGKGKGKKPRVLKTWEYECPVQDCKRVHVRVFVGSRDANGVEEGKWIGKGEMGEIGVYT